MKEIIEADLELMKMMLERKEHYLTHVGYSLIKKRVEKIESDIKN